MTDLVDRFRTLARAARDHGTEYASVTHEEADQAAAEIERLREVSAAMREALQKIARSKITENNPYWWRWAQNVMAAARAALSKASGEGV